MSTRYRLELAKAIDREVVAVVEAQLERHHRSVSDIFPTTRGVETE
jgi:hypothetical protein